MFRKPLALLAATLLAAPLAAADLGLGDAPPALDVHWVKGEPVTAFASGQVYVVEFWATWCPPCRKSIPHLSGLQAKYGDDVAIVGVSVWEEDPAAVEPFVEKMGDKMAYRVAKDVVEGDEGHMAKSWMQAAGQDGIPTAFIIDRKGRIAWIGHPMEMDEPLERVVAGEWDVESALARAEEDAKLREAVASIEEAVKDKRWAAVVEQADAFIESDPQMESWIGFYRFLALIRMSKFDDAYGYGKAYLAGAGKDNVQALNSMAWMVVDPSRDRLEVRDLDFALAAAQRANELTEASEPSILDTLARVWFEKGEVKKAIELQQKAVELADNEQLKESLRRTLEEYQGKSRS